MNRWFARGPVDNGRWAVDKIPWDLSEKWMYVLMDISRQSIERIYNPVINRSYFVQIECVDRLVSLVFLIIDMPNWHFTRETVNCELIKYVPSPLVFYSKYDEILRSSKRACKQRKTGISANEICTIRLLAFRYFLVLVYIYSWSYRFGRRHETVGFPTGETQSMNKHHRYHLECHRWFLLLFWALEVDFHRFFQRPAWSRYWIYLRQLLERKSTSAENQPLRNLFSNTHLSSNRVTELGSFILGRCLYSQRQSYILGYDDIQ